MEIIERRLNELHPYKNNPRKNDGAVDAVMESIKEFGFRVPIVIDKNDEIVAGHTRYKAAKKLGIKSVPCIIADDLTDEQITAYRLVDNKTQELSNWDFAKLIAELRELTEDFDMQLFGFGAIDGDDEVGESKPKEQTIRSGGELDLDDFEDETFTCTCPSCGFRFND